MLRMVIALLVIQQHVIVASQKRDGKWIENEHKNIPLDKLNGVRNELDAIDEIYSHQRFEESGDNQNIKWGKKDFGGVFRITELDANDIGANMEAKIHQELDKKEEKPDKDMNMISIILENMKVFIGDPGNNTGHRLGKRDGLQDEDVKGAEEIIVALDKRDLETKDTGTDLDNRHEQNPQSRTGSRYSFKRYRENSQSKGQKDNKDHARKGRNWAERSSPKGTSGRREEVGRPDKKWYSLRPRADSRKQNTATSRRPFQAKCKSYHERDGCTGFGTTCKSFWSCVCCCWGVKCLEDKPEDLYNPFALVGRGGSLGRGHFDK